MHKKTIIPAIIGSLVSVVSVQSTPTRGLSIAKDLHSKQKHRYSFLCQIDFAQSRLSISRSLFTLYVQTCPNCFCVVPSNCPPYFLPNRFGSITPECISRSLLTLYAMSKPVQTAVASCHQIVLRNMIVGEDGPTPPSGGHTASASAQQL